MLVAIQPSLERAQGACELVLSGRSGQTRLAHLYQHDPCRILFPRVDPGELTTAIVANTSGGLAGGDRLRVDIKVEDGGQAVVTGQSAEKVYRSLGPATELTVDLAVADGGWLEYLPQETILFDGARLARTTEIAVDRDARFMAGDIVVQGRTARGERFDRGAFHDRWTLRIDGRLVWADALGLSGDIPALRRHPAGFGGAIAHATLLYAAPDAAERLAFLRDLIEESGVRGGATRIGPVLIARLLADETAPLRRTVARLWSALRAKAAGLPGTVPRVWQV
ncbi:MAG: urease accessory protein UreD [Candidatus Eiseniibacteriota bacterium]